MIALLLKAGKTRIIFATAGLVVLIASADWGVGRNVSLAALYILPMMLGAVVFPPTGTLALAILCSSLRGGFDVPGSTLEVVLRFIFAVLAYFLAALFVGALVRNHELTIQHLDKVQFEQTRRREAEEQLRVLAESSPAAILTMDSSGTVLATNSAADSLFAMPEGQTIQGRRIGIYLPMFTDALAVETGSRGLRTAAQCQGYRENGEVFLAHVWFSSYTAPEGKRLAAIIVDSSEELRDREERGLHQLLLGNRIAAAAVAHEVRNFCGAMVPLCANLRERHSLGSDADLQGLVNLAAGLEAIASRNLQSHGAEALEQVSLKELLDDLRIMIESDWREIEGIVKWHLPPTLPSVIAEPHGLLQAFLNLAQNSHRAVQAGPRRELNITISSEEQKVRVRFEDSGPGIAKPESLFEPFQQGASGAGLGLYVSRFIMRSYGGELRFEPQPAGSCFVIELQAA